MAWKRYAGNKYGSRKVEVNGIVFDEAGGGAVPGASAPRKSRRNKGYPAAGQICADPGAV